MDDWDFILVMMKIITAVDALVVFIIGYLATSVHIGFAIPFIMMFALLLCGLTFCKRYEATL